MNPTIVAAIVAGVISLIGALLSFAAAYWQVRGKLDELLQSQFKDVVAKRIETYPKLWRIPQELLSDWERLQKPINEEWARALLARLIEWHTEYGVFLSQQAYEAFSALRHEALEVVRRCDKGQHPTLDDLQTMDRIFYAGYSEGVSAPRHRPLATCLKNDLGSYRVTALAVKEG